MNIGANTFLDVEMYIYLYLSSINPKIVLLVGMNIFIEVTY